MMKHRGYDVSSEEAIIGFPEKNIEGWSESTFNDYYSDLARREKKDFRRVLMNVYHRKAKEDESNRDITSPIIEDKEDNALIYFAKSDSTNVNVSVVSEFLNEIMINKCGLGIIILPVPVVPKGASDMKAFTTATIQSFLEQELGFNIIKHIYVPRHELLSPVQANEVLRRNKATLIQLPQISINDPVVKFNGWKIGGIVRISREELFLDLVNRRYYVYKAISNILT